MTSISDDVENILNGKFEPDMGLGFFNDVTFGLQTPTQFNAPPPTSSTPVPVQQHHSPALTHSHMTPQMPKQMLAGQGGPGPGSQGPGGPQGPPQGHPQGIPQQQQQPPPQQQPQFRATPQQMAAQLLQGVPPGQAAPLAGPLAGGPHAGPLSHPATPNMRMAPLSATTPTIPTPGGPGNAGQGRTPQVAERVHLLLHINNELIKQLSTLPPKSPVHGECLKRLEVNVAYMHALATEGRAHQVAMTLPQILQPPPEVPSLAEPYRRLQR